MVQQTATTVDIDAKVVQVPTVADLDVQPQRVAGTQTWRWKFFNLDQRHGKRGKSRCLG